MKCKLHIAMFVLSLLLFLALAALWHRSKTGQDEFMIPVAEEKRLLITFHYGQWIELTLMDRWPDCRLGWWSGPGWRNVGLLKFWQAHRASKYGPAWIMEGQMIYPLTGPGGSPAYERSYDRAVAAGYPGAVLGSPEWGLTVARAIKLPFAPFLVLSIIPCSLLGVRLFTNWHRRRQRIRNGLCLACGYNLTGNVSGVCPECGMAIQPAAGGG